ncbi:MAG: NAD-binding protein, partial [Bacteroidota bacterium]|nr:NAD-binding protein [Bacteroidota bacterium]
MNKITFKQRFKYFFDNTLSRGTISIVIWLSVITLFLVLFFTGIYLITGIAFEDSGKLNFFEAFWQSLMRSLDPGTVAGDTIWILRIVGIIVTVAGIFILSALIGILSSGLENKLTELRKGRSIVLTKGHTLIIGWSPKILHIISQLIIANENQKNASIVILANKDKVEMDDEIRDKISNTKTTKIICRTGNAIEATDLIIANPDLAKSIIILAPENIPEEIHDIHVIKTILAITYSSERKEEKYHIVAEIRNKENYEAAKIVGKDEVCLIFNKDVVSRLTAQTSHQSGLSVIYMDLLAYDGDELYMIKEAKLVGKSYKDVLFAYETSTIIGIIDKNEKVLINPPMDIIIDEQMQLIAISEDDDTVILSGKTDYNIISDKIVEKKRSSSALKERNLVLGWNSKAFYTIKELDNYVDSNSELVIVIQNDEVDTDIDLLEEELVNQTVVIKKGDYSKRNILLDLNIESYDNIIILSNEKTTPQIADSITILALIHIRNITEEQNVSVNIISEMYDQKNRELAEVTEANDFIISYDFI